MVPMVSTNSSPPIAMPVQVPHGRVVQQIVDESGTLRHVILSPQHPPMVPMATHFVLAMEECSECLGNLIEQLKDNGGVRYGPQKIITVVVGIAKALQNLHEEKGLLHGDLKSYNVLIKGDFEEVKLCDFGVSLELKTAKVEDYVGTGAWSAPEVLVDGPLTDRADIFSLGLIIWEMLTLKAPHVDDMENSLTLCSDTSSFEYEQHFGETPALPEGLPPNYALVQELYEWCTQQKWDQRPRARDILTRLSENGISLCTPTPQITL